MLSGFASALQLVSLVGSLTISSYICQPPTAPTISVPVDGSVVTVGSPFTVSGNGPSESSIIISNDGNPLITVQADSSNQFSANVTVATQGEHTMSVQSSRPCGTAQGGQITVTAHLPIPVDPTNPTNPSQPPQPIAPNTPNQPQPTDEIPPIDTPTTTTDSDEQGTSKGLFLNVTNPINNSATTDPSVFVSGSTNYASTISILVNGTNVGTTHVDYPTFGLNTPLNIGDNTIVITATSEEGTASVKLNVTRHPSENVQVVGDWQQSEAGKTAIKVVAVSAISLLVLLVIIGLILL